MQRGGAVCLADGLSAESTHCGEPRRHLRGKTADTIADTIVTLSPSGALFDFLWVRVLL